MVTEESSAYLQKVYSAKDNRDLKEAYDRWAENTTSMSLHSVIRFRPLLRGFLENT